MSMQENDLEGRLRSVETAQATQAATLAGAQATPVGRHGRYDRDASGRPRGDVGDNGRR